MVANVNRLVNDVKSENDRWRSRMNLYRFIVGVAFIGWIVFVIASIYSHHHLSPLTHSIFLLLGVIFGQEGIGLLSRPTIRHRSAILALTKRDETDFIGPLLESIYPSWVAGGHIFRADSKLYYAVIDALTRLLPQLTESEYQMLTRSEKNALYAMLSSEYEAVALPAMEIVTRLKDRRVSSILEKIARRRAKTETAVSLREAAKASLIRL